ncbi:MAG: RsmD family RNA methyltransferase [Synergistaceae bacterium]
MKDMRPTTGKVLLALFNILGPLQDKSFLDLFSGSGQISFTASNKGASPIYSVESERKRYVEISKKAPKNVTCFCLDVRRALSKFLKNGEMFDVIFADPPYGLGWGKEFPSLIEKNAELLSPNGVIVFEHSDSEEIMDISEDLWEREDRCYGKTILSFYRRKSI